MIRDAQARRFLSAWQAFQERYRVVSKSYSSSISLLELSILIELQIERGRSQATLARLFQVPSPTVFRAAQRLKELRFVAEFEGDGDARIKSLQLTGSGTKELASIDNEANLILKEMAAALSSKELKRFVSLLAVMEAYFSVERAKIRRVDHRLRGPIRTFTRGFGLLGNSAFGVQAVSTFDWHVLSAIDEARESIYAMDLSNRFHAPNNSISVLLQRFEEKDLVKRVRSLDGDRRLKPLVLLPKGRALLRKIETNAVKLIQAAMAPLTERELPELCDLMERFVDVQPGECLVSVPFRVKPINDERGEGQSAGVYLSSELVGRIEQQESSAATELKVVELLKRLLKH